MKPLVAAAAIEAGVARPNEIIDCENGSYRFGRHLINDVHPKELLTVQDVVIQSSNIGMTKIGMRLGEKRLHQALHIYGFGQYSGLNLPGESRGIFRPLKSWAKVDVATHSFGQGIAVNPLQVVRAVAAIAGDGHLPTLSVVQGAKKKRARRILSESTAKVMRETMIGVVEHEKGTGRRARIDGVRVGGKTGTAQIAKRDGRGYEQGAYIASFVGFVDARKLGIKERLVLLVSIERPDTTSIYGGTLAGPVFQRIMNRTLHKYMTRGAKKNRIFQDTSGFINASYTM